MFSRSHHVWTLLAVSFANDMYPCMKNWITAKREGWVAIKTPKEKNSILCRMVVVVVVVADVVADGYLFVFHIAETILRTRRIDGLREKGRTSSHIHLFPIYTHSSSHCQKRNTNTNIIRKGWANLSSKQFTVFCTTLFIFWIKNSFSVLQQFLAIFPLCLHQNSQQFLYKLWPCDSFWGEAIECNWVQFIKIKIWYAPNTNKIHTNRNVVCTKYK